MSVSEGSEVTTTSPDEQAPMVLSESMEAIWAPMLAMVPDAEDTGYENILAQLAEATPEAIDDPWTAANGIKSIVGRPFRCHSIARHASDYSGGFGWYLTLEVDMLDDGEQAIITCSAIGAVAQLVRLNAVDAFPVDMVAVEAAKPTKRGFRPIHLKPYAAARRVAG